MLANNKTFLKHVRVFVNCGLRNWLAQRLTGTVIAFYTIVILVELSNIHNFSYKIWTSMFSLKWIRFSTFAMFLSVFYHAWIGVKDILTDYVKSFYALLFLKLLSILWLLICLGYAIKILWKE